MAKFLEIEGNDEADELKKLSALVKLKELDTNSLVRLAELSDNEKAKKFLKTSFQFEILKAALKRI